MNSDSEVDLRSDPQTGTPSALLQHANRTSTSSIMATDPQIIALQEARTVPEVEILDPRGAELFLEGQQPSPVGDAGQFGFTEG